MRFCIPNDGKKITTYTAAYWLHQTQGSIGGNCRINSISPLFQNINGYLGGKWLAGGGHSVLRDDLGPGGEVASRDPVGGVGAGGEGGEGQGR